MKLLILLFSIGLMVALSSQSEAATRTSKRASKVSKVLKHKKKVKLDARAIAKKKNEALIHGDLQTDVSFDDSVLRGQYQAPEEALVKVENEKGFSDLLGVRKHFKDRLSVAAEQE